MHPKTEMDKNSEEMSPDLRKLLGGYANCKTSEEADARHKRNVYQKRLEMALNFKALCNEIKEEIINMQRVLDRFPDTLYKQIPALANNKSHAKSLFETARRVAIVINRVEMHPFFKKDKRSTGKSSLNSIVDTIDKAQTSVGRALEINVEDMSETTNRLNYDSRSKGKGKMLAENDKEPAGTRPFSLEEDNCWDVSDKIEAALNEVKEQECNSNNDTQKLEGMSKQIEKGAYLNDAQKKEIAEQIQTLQRELDSFFGYSRSMGAVCRRGAAFFSKGEYKEPDEVLCKKIYQNVPKSLENQYKACKDGILRNNQEIFVLEEHEKHLNGQIKNIKDKGLKYKGQYKKLCDTKPQERNDVSYQNRLYQAKILCVENEITVDLLEKEVSKNKEKIRARQETGKRLESEKKKLYQPGNLQTFLRSIVIDCINTDNFNSTGKPDATSSNIPRSAPVKIARHRQ